MFHLDSRAYVRPKQTYTQGRFTMGAWKKSANDHPIVIPKVSWVFSATTISKYIMGDTKEMFR